MSALAPNRSAALTPRAENEEHGARTDATEADIDFDDYLSSSPERCSQSKRENTESTTPPPPAPATDPSFSIMKMSDRHRSIRSKYGPVTDGSVLPASLEAGSIQWLAKGRMTARPMTKLRVRDTTGKLIARGSLDHPSIPLYAVNNRRCEELHCICVELTTFQGTNHAEWLEQGRPVLVCCKSVPTLGQSPVESGPDADNGWYNYFAEGVPSTLLYLFLKEGALDKTSYVKVEYIFRVPISQLYPIKDKKEVVPPTNLSFISMRSVLNMIGVPERHAELYFGWVKSVLGKRRKEIKDRRETAEFERLSKRKFFTVDQLRIACHSKNVDTEFFRYPQTCVGVHSLEAPVDYDGYLRYMAVLEGPRWSQIVQKRV